jgi:long-chain fatty acid transport protein
MSRIFIPRLIPALLSIAFAGAASASGFQLYGEQGASGIGNAGAGSAASAENASTVYYNPAGMTQLPQYAISAGGTGVYTKFEFTNNGSDVAGFNNAGTGGNAGGWGFVPNGYGSMALTKDIYIGIGIGAPFGLATAYSTPWIGSPQSTSFDIKTYNINPSIAWRAAEWVSLGAGLNVQKVEATYKRIASAAVNPANGRPVGITNCAAPPPSAAVAAVWTACNTPIKMGLDDWAWGWNVGALFTLAPQTKIGLAYRSQVKYNTSGNVNGNGPSPAFNSAVSSNVSADIDMPDTFVISLSQGIGENWELLGDISWTGWSSIPQVDIIRTSPTTRYPAGSTAQVLETKFDDAWRFAVGANYKVNEAWKLRFGLAYDQTPVPSAEYRLTSLPDNNRTWFSTGVQWKPEKNMALDFGVAYLYLKDADINNDQRLQGRGLVKGSYDDACWLIGGQASMNF